ncbi:hypothetical protein [Nannocystis pusilla]|uniref:hypothetical protein n=1 Tax=Nannocystis pusilla TaxID=889268 RepID=UPI003DA55CCE
MLRTIATSVAACSRVSSWKLEHFEHEGVGRGRPGAQEVEQGGGERDAEVAADEGPQAAGGEQGAGEGGDGALAVGAGDEDGRQAAEAGRGDRQRQAHLAVDPGPRGELPLGRAEALGRDAGAQDHEVDAGEGFGRDVGGPEHRLDAVGDGGAGVLVVEADAGAEEHQQLGRGPTAGAGADDEGGAAGEVEVGRRVRVHGRAGVRRGGERGRSRVRRVGGRGRG